MQKILHTHVYFLLAFLLYLVDVVEIDSRGMKEKEGMTCSKEPTLHSNPRLCTKGLRLSEKSAIYQVSYWGGPLLSAFSVHHTPPHTMSLRYFECEILY